MCQVLFLAFQEVILGIKLEYFGDKIFIGLVLSKMGDFCQGKIPEI